jgi:DNA polymerase-3 subunit gamma/tau
LGVRGGFFVGELAMSYLVLARKYRPQTFADVVGQDVIVKTLSKALETGRIAHAFLFTGSRGVGKTSVARLLAKALACEKGISPTPCGECSHCQEITRGTSMDVVEIDGASNTSVDDVRDLRETIRYQPSSCRFKIFIIDEVHMLSNSAFNALLKTLEEPPPHVKFIFATTESHKIPVTILSRCQRYDFKRLTTEMMVDRLKFVLKQENIVIDPAGLMLIAQSAEGGMRDALSLTDQVLSFSSDHASLEDVTQTLGLLDRKSIVHAVDTLIAGDAKGALTVIDKAMLGGYDLKQLIDGVTTEFRHLAVASSVGSIAGLIDLTEEDIAAIDRKAKALDAQDLQRLFAMSLDSVDQVSRSDQPRLMLELAFLRMADRPLMAETTTISHAIARLEALASGAPIPPLELTQAQASPLLKTTAKVEAKIEPKLEVKPEPKIEIKPEPKPEVKAPPKEPEEPVLEGIDQKWLRFVDVATRQITSIGHHLEHARVHEVLNERGANVIRVEFEQTLHYSQIVQASGEIAFQALLAAHYGKGAKLDPFLSESASEDAPLTINEARDVATKKAQDELETEAQNHPVVQKALSLFGGEIRAVKRAT